MAEETAVGQTIDLKLDYITAEVEGLATVVEDWDTWPENAQTLFYLEWEELMARVKGLEQAYQAGKMTPDQRDRYQALLSKLKAVLPAIQHLDLAPPPVLWES